MSKICLSFVFNHQFEQNIPKLKKIYNGRFSTIRYLSPFSSFNDDEEIIPIYESSVHFQGYFAQSYKYLPNDCEYYIFCGDDLLLHPSLNEENIISKLNCENASYIKYLNPVWEHSFAWHKFEECNNFPGKDCMVPFNQFLPSRDRLLKLYSDFGFKYKNIGFHNLMGVYNQGLTWERFKSGVRYLFQKKFKRYVHSPLIEGYSDFIIIPKESLRLFCHYCGVFAAMNLWVDAAIATAMILSSGKIRTEKDHSYKGTEIWNESMLVNKIAKSENKLNQLSKVFENDEFYIHPIKLSKFT
jgi:hypothetical protein